MVPGSLLRNFVVMILKLGLMEAKVLNQSQSNTEYILCNWKSLSHREWWRQGPGSNEDKQLTPTMTVMVKEKVGSFHEKVNCCKEWLSDWPPNYIVYVKVAELDDTDYADSDSNSEDNLSTVEKVEDFQETFDTNLVIL